MTCCSVLCSRASTSNSFLSGRQGPSGGPVDRYNVNVTTALLGPEKDWKTLLPSSSVCAEAGAAGAGRALPPPGLLSPALVTWIKDNGDNLRKKQKSGV